MGQITSRSYPRPVDGGGKARLRAEFPPGLEGFRGGRASASPTPTNAKKLCVGGAPRTHARDARGPAAIRIIQEGSRFKVEHNLNLEP